MEQKKFFEKVGKLFDTDAKFTPNPFGSASWTFSETEKTAFLKHLWVLFVEEAIDFESAEFILALQKVQHQYRSVQEQASHLCEAIKKVSAALKAKSPTGVTTP